MYDRLVARAGVEGWGRWMRGRRGRLGVALLAVGCLAAALARPPVELVSVNIFGGSGNAASNSPAANADGSFVAFYSDASNLVPRDTNAARDVFVRDRVAQVTERVSVNTAGEQANGPSQAEGDAPGISGNGKTVTFYSEATNLVSGDTNGASDVFVRVRDAGTTELISVGVGGAQANGPSFFPSISADGRFVAFQSLATNLVAESVSGQADIYVRDRVAGTTVRACPSFERNGPSIAPSISADGTAVAFGAADTALAPKASNKYFQIYVCVLQTQAVTVASVNDELELGNADSFLPALDQDGLLVAFKSSANNLVPNDINGVVDVFARVLQPGATELISVSFRGASANDISFPPSVDYDGRFVAFSSLATNLVPDDYNQVASVFVRDRQGDVTFLGDVNDRGEQANGGTPDDPPSLSGDGKALAYASTATNLAPNDRDPILDVFIGGNPFACNTRDDCPAGFECFNGFCQVLGSPTPTPTPGPNDCCQCTGPACQAPGSGTGCPSECPPVYNALCEGGTSCVTFTPTATPTPGPNDCCQCSGPVCQAPGSGTGCPGECPPVYSALCQGGTSCVTFTPTRTPTPTPTAGPNDCCQCAGPICEAPGIGTGCRSECPPVYQAACVENRNCVAFTPTVTPTPTGHPSITPTVMPTPTGGPRDCCQCGANQCQAPGATGCPAECQVVRDATCQNNTTCVTFTPTPTLTRTPTPTLTPTAGPRDCCQCGQNQCEGAGNDGCPPGCDIVKEAACIGGTTCTAFTPTPTGTVTQTRSQTPTVTPTGAVKFDDDSCRIAPPASDGGGGVGLLWLVGPVALLLWRRRAVRSDR